MTDARYEFRHFGEGLSKYREMFRERSTDEILRESDEKYLVSPRIDRHNFKLRFEKLDIKELIGTKGKLEQWYPVVKTGFPVDAQLLVEKICPLMEIHPEIIKKSSYSLKEFMEEIVAEQDHLHLADVSKKRYGYKINECMAEYAEVRINGRDIQTLSIESLNPEKILETMKMFGMEGMENVSYVKAIKEVAL